MSTHTPGPWPFVYVSGAIRHLVRNVERDCFVSDEELVAAGQPDFSWSRYDDARLIAAAPELLEALKRVMDWHCDAVDNGQTGRPECLCDSCLVGRAAIAKAEGKS